MIDIVAVMSSAEHRHWMMEEYSPDDLVQTQLQAVTAFGAHTQIRKDEETSVRILVLAVLEVIERRYDGPSRAPRLAILSFMWSAVCLNTPTGWA